MRFACFSRSFSFSATRRLPCEKELEASHKELAENVKDRGEFIELTDDQLNEFRSYGEAAWKEWLVDAESKGYNADEMLKDYNSMLEEAGYPIPYQK